MAIRDIRLFGDPVLRTACEPIETIDDGVRALVADLCDTVAFDGRAGLASTQIGYHQRAFSLHIDGEVSYVLNPEIVELAGEPVPTGEGCLSVPDLWFDVLRYPRATVRGIDLDGREVVISGSGLLAQALQHECDHLDGKLYISRLDREARGEAMRQIRTSTWF
ncbi:peptide deformylase [Leucobacter salsicius]|uniref:peptide deformylase n=1 Tax=Leucobacter salsicius TaxID=664638 RepID=UPI00034C852B|nr:peptide deformylase [Leucobacter salsicius]